MAIVKQGTAYWKKEIKKTLSEASEEALKELKKYKEIVDYWKDRKKKGFKTSDEVMKSCGFTKRFFGKPAWGHLDKGIVIKIPYYVGNKKPFFAIPTMDYGELVVQPMAEIANADTNKAYNILRDIVDRSNISVDLHYGNIGMWRGIPVAFDW